MPPKKQLKFNIKVNFLNGSKFSYEELMKKPILINIAENQNLLNDFNLLFNPKQEAKRIYQKRQNKIYAKKQFYINELRKLEEEQDYYTIE